MKPKAVKQISTFLCSITVLILLAGCALSITPKTEKPEATPLILPEQVEAPKLVPVEFYVELKRSYSPETVLALEVLDDISGLDRNISRYELTKLEDNHYAGTLKLPNNGVIKYRYISTFPISQPEAAADGSKVIYRTMTVKENVRINDIIAGWPELPYEGEIGKITGIISDQATNQPIPDVLVTVAGYQTFTDMTGRFDFENIPAGVHNVSAITLIGAYLPYQQEANILADLSTPAVIKMTPLSQVTVTFKVSLPEEADGAPVRLAGSLYQLGNVYADLPHEISSVASLMPLLSRSEDGSYSLRVKLPAGTDLVYRYTLGNGFWNAERDEEGKLVTRRFIVPDRDVTVEDEVITWRVSGMEPITIKVNVPADTPAEDTISIQFLQGAWQQPIPMWPLGNNQWMFLLFADQGTAQNMQYRICRNDQCDIAYDEASFAAPISLANLTSTTSTHTVTTWHAWHSREDMTPGIIISDELDQLIGAEFTPDFRLIELNSYRDGINELQKSRFNWVIFTPSWKVNTVNGLPRLSPNQGDSLSLTDLASLVQLAKTKGFTVGIYPRLEFSADSGDWWQAIQRDALWWQEWYQQYERFVMSYTQFAAKYEVDQLILGGADVAASLPGAVQTTATNKGTPKNAAQLWENLLQKVAEYYHGQLLWALMVGESELPAYSFYDHIGGFYLQFQAPTDPNAYFDQQTVADFLDDRIADFHNKYADKVLYAGLNAPSLSAGNFSCTSGDCLLSPRDHGYEHTPVDLNAQLSFYDDYGSALYKRTWIQGVSSRGFFPAVKLQDFSSSIYGKPAMEWIASRSIIQ